MGNSPEKKIYEFEDFRLDAAHRLLYHHTEQVSLSPKAVETLLALVKRSGEVVSKQELMEMIWADTVVEESNLAQYLHLLRKTLGKREDGKQFIETLKRRGYRFNGSVTISEGAVEASTGRRSESVKLDEKTPSHEPGSDNPSIPGPRVERHGNVLTLVDWQENKKESVEEISVAETRSVDGPSRSKSVFRLPIIAAAAAALLLVGVFYFWPNVSSKGKKVAAMGDMTVLSLTSGEVVDFATISPDGNYFVYTSRDDGRAHLWLQQTREASRRELIDPFDGAILGTTFSPDSRSVYFTAGEGPGTPNSLYRVPALGGVRTKILYDINSPVAVSPDGEELAFTRWDQAASRSSIIIASADGTRERILLTRTGGESVVSGPWSPDGKLIAYSAYNTKTNDGQCTIEGIDPQSGATRLLSPERWDTCFRMAWTSDGQGLVFPGTKFREAYSTRRDQIFYLSIADGEARRLTVDGNRHQYASIGVTVKDEILVVPFNRASQVWSMDMSGDSRTAVQLTTGQADGRGGIDTINDGRLSFLTRNGDGFSIWLMNSDGTGRRQLTTDPPGIEELRAAPDGRFFVFASKLEDFSHLYRVDSNGENLRQLTFGKNLEEDSDVSPDGQWIVYSSAVFNNTYGKRAIWKVASEGGDPVKLSDIDCMAPFFSNDGKYVSCVSAALNKIWILSADDGTTLKIFEPAPNAGLSAGARWTPDGKAFAYICFNNNVGNLWLQPIDGGAPHRLTDFTSGDLYNFAFGFGDSRLYLARGHSIRNAVLISNFR